MQSITKQLSIGVAGLVCALAIVAAFTTTTVHAQSATTTVGTTTTHYLFEATMSPANEVPPITTTTSTTTNGGTSTSTATTTGLTRIWLDETMASGTPASSTSIWKMVSIWNGDDITMAHLHCGLPGQTGPVVLDLYHGSTTDVNGVLVGTTSASMSDLHATSSGCSMPILNMMDLAKAMKAGIIYANVHSVAFPTGVVRGQLMQISSTTDHSSTTVPGNVCTNNANNGWYDSMGKWHMCNGSGSAHCMASSTMSGWYGNDGMWHNCNNNGGGGTTTPPVPPIPGFPNGLPGGIGSSINSLIGKILGNVQHILNNFLPTGTSTDNPLRSIRTLR